MSPHDQFSRIIESLQDATLDDSLWSETAGLIDAACGATGNMLGFAEGCSVGDPRVFFVRFCERGQRRVDWEREYFATYFSQDERIPRLRAAPDSRLIHCGKLFTEAERKTSRVYNDFLRRLNAQNSLSVQMQGPGSTRIMWTIADPLASGGWHPEQIGLIRRLLPHMRRYVLARQTLFDARAMGKSLAALLDNTGCGVLQLDFRGRIFEANDVARDILRKQDGLFDRGGHLHARNPEDQARLQRVLDDVLPGLRSAGVSGMVTIGRSSLISRLMVYAAPLGEWHSDCAGPQVSALAFLVDPEREARIDPAVVREALGLTRAESQIAAKIAVGRNVRDLALATARRESTIRSHIKRMLAKLGLSRQVQLVRRVLALKGFER